MSRMHFKMNLHFIVVWGSTSLKQQVRYLKFKWQQRGQNFWLNGWVFVSNYVIVGSNLVGGTYTIELFFI